MNILFPIRPDLHHRRAGARLPGWNPAPAADPQAPVSVLVLLGEWFGDAYFPLQKEIESRGWAQKRVGVEVEYRGCYNKKRDVVLRSDVLIPDLKDFSGYDAVIISSGPQYRKFNLNPVVLDFLKDAHAAGLLMASFCVGNNVVDASGLLGRPLGEDRFPKQATWIDDRTLIGPRGGGPPPGDGFESAPVKEVCDAIARKLESRAARPAGSNRAFLSGMPGNDERWPIAQALRECIGWAKTKDFRMLYSVIANDADFLEVHPDGAVVKGFEEFRKAEIVLGQPGFQGRPLRDAGPQDHLVQVRRRGLVLLPPGRHQRVEREARQLGEHPLDRRPGEAGRPLDRRPAAFFVRPEELIRPEHGGRQHEPIDGTRKSGPKARSFHEAVASARDRGRREPAGLRGQAPGRFPHARPRQQRRALPCRQGRNRDALYRPGRQGQAKARSSWCPGGSSIVPEPSPVRKRTSCWSSFAGRPTPATFRASGRSRNIRESDF